MIRNANILPVSAAGERANDPGKKAPLILTLAGEFDLVTTPVGGRHLPRTMANVGFVQ